MNSRNCSLAADAVQSFSRSSNRLGRCRSQVSLGTSASRLAALQYQEFHFHSQVTTHKVLIQRDDNFPRNRRSTTFSQETSGDTRTFLPWLA